MRVVLEPSHKNNMSDNFCLQWTNYENHLLTYFKELKDDKDVNDVTLFCDDDQQIEANRVVLSAVMCSLFHYATLKQTYIKAVKPNYLFVYIRLRLSPQQS